MNCKVCEGKLIIEEHYPDFIGGFARKIYTCKHCKGTGKEPGKKS